MLQQTFLQKVMLTVICGFFAACLLWMFRNIIERAFYETGDGWKDIFTRSTQTAPRR